MPRRLTYFFDDEMAKWETLDLRCLRGGKGKSHPKSTRPVQRGSRKSSPPPPQPGPLSNRPLGRDVEAARSSRSNHDETRSPQSTWPPDCRRPGPARRVGTEYPVRTPQSPVTGGVRDPEKYSVDWMMIVPVPIGGEGSAVDGRRGGEMAGWSGGVVEWWRGRKWEEEEESGGSREESGEWRVENGGNSPRSWS